MLLNIEYLFENINTCLLDWCNKLVEKCDWNHSLIYLFLQVGYAWSYNVGNPYTYVNETEQS